MWLAVAGPDAARAAALIEAEFLDALDDAGRRAASAAIDLDADENACPACEAPFAGHPTHCPGCGLRIG